MVISFNTARHPPTLQKSPTSLGGSFPQVPLFLLRNSVLTSTPKRQNLNTITAYASVTFLNELTGQSFQIIYYVTLTGIVESNRNVTLWKSIYDLTL